MNKKRQQIYDKTGGKCYYCGCELPKRWHVDHFWPQLKSHWLKSDLMMEGLPAPENLKDINDPRNLVPSCPRCNIRKHTLTVEEFREAIKDQINQLNERSNQYSLAKDFGLIEETGIEVEFYFERMAKGVIA